MSNTDARIEESLPEKASPAAKPNMFLRFGHLVTETLRPLQEVARSLSDSPVVQGAVKLLSVHTAHVVQTTAAALADGIDAHLGPYFFPSVGFQNYLHGIAKWSHIVHECLDSDFAIQQMRSRILEHWEIPYRFEVSVMRQVFHDLPATESKIRDETHSHGRSAGARSDASTTGERLGKALGLRPYFYQRSAADVRQQRAGNRTWYWHKDTSVPVEEIAIDDRQDLIVMVDVDYYVDMPFFLSKHFCPVYLYSFAPKQVARTAQDYSYWFNPSGCVQYVVSGGEKYEHFLWDYSDSNLSVMSTAFGIPNRVTTYFVERKHVDADHEMILLIPVKRWTGYTALFSAFWLGANQLKRLDVRNKEFAQLRTIGLKGDHLSVGLLGEPIEATVPTAEMRGLELHASTSKYPLTLPSVLKHVNGDTTRGAMVLAYVKRVEKEKPPIVCPPSEAVRRYQANVSVYDPAAKPGLSAFMSPIVHEAYAPDSCLGSDLQAVDGRLTKVRPPELKLSHSMSKMMDDFIVLFTEGFNQKLSPVAYEEVLDRQSRPMQRTLLHRAENLLGKDSKGPVKTFCKKEAYPKIADPRIISTLETPVKREYSQYMYALEKVFKVAPWYAFGKSPSAIATRVAQIASQADSLCNTDFSRFDGHGSNVMRELEQRLLMAVFKRTHHSEILALHRQQYGQKAVTYYGVWYETGYSRLSGSPETSLFNSLVNAFIAYVALRRTLRNGAPPSSKQAYNKLGIYGGDDGLTPDVDPTRYKLTATSFGQDLTIEPLMKGEMGVKFLSRMYSPCVWFGDVNSCCDIKRQISKIHTTVVMPAYITPTEKLLEKVRAFSLTDLNTPIVGDFVKCALSLHQKEFKGEALEQNQRMMQFMPYWLDAHPDEQYPNHPGEWMLALANAQLPEFDYGRFLRTLVIAKETGKLSDLLSLPIMTDPSDPVESKFSVVFEDKVMGPASLPAPSAERPPKLPVRPQDSLPVPAVKEKKSPHPEAPDAKDDEAGVKPPEVKSPARERKGTNVDGKRKPKAPEAGGAKPRETREACMARKKLNKTWVDRPSKTGETSVPKPKPVAQKTQWRHTGAQES